jgi:autotransporter-associated beta strand protein
LQAGQVTLDGGDVQIAPTTATLSITNVRRGITVAAGGGTIDTQSFPFTWAGPILGTGTLNKIGSATLRLSQGAGTPSPYPSTFTGTINVNGGMLQLDNGTAMGDTAAVVLANTSGVSFNITASETIGSLAGGGTTGGSLALGSSTLTTGGNNTSTSFAGGISGTGGVTKMGGGIWTLGGSNTYTGATTINAGTIKIAASNNLGSTSNSLVLNGGTLELASDMTMSRPLTVNAGGGAIRGTILPAISTAPARRPSTGTSASTARSASLRTGGAVSVTPGATVTVNAGRGVPPRRQRGGALGRRRSRQHRQRFDRARTRS